MVLSFARKGYLACVLSMLAIGMSHGQSKLDSIQHLDEVTVTARSFSFKEVIPSQKLSGKELQNLNSHTVADALRYFSGVQLKDYGGVGGIKTVNIRSMGTNHMGVFYDGIELSNAQNGQVDLGMYSLDNIEEISLYNGQKSDIFQSAKDFGAAGTLYLRSRRPRFEDGKTTNIRATMKVGSFDVINPSALFEYKISENIAASFSAEWLSGSGKYKFRYRRINPAGEIAYDTTAVRENGYQRHPPRGRIVWQDERRYLESYVLQLQFRTRYPGGYRKQRMATRRTSMGYELFHARLLYQRNQ